MTVKAYQPLARKYRPQTFQDLVGQDATHQALANAIEMGREPHGVIFSGVRGIGKTTTARLYAKALNCQNGPTPEPCNQCESCFAITEGTHEDVIEIDGASNTSVDNIRNLRDTIQFVPQRSKFKVYIIDEVHMLSQSAFNALLKTLEEPPAHVVFVFATTELQKIPQTIISRCQLYYLQKFNLETIKARLVSILTKENLEFESQALTIIAREGHGSMRDALTLLDHVIAVGHGKVTLDALSKIIVNVQSTPFIELLSALLARNAEAVIQKIQQFAELGLDFKDVAEKTAAMARHAMIARDLGANHLEFSVLGLDDQETNSLLSCAKSSNPSDLNRLFRILVRCHRDLDGSALDRFILENTCLEWCFDPGLLMTTAATNNQSINSPIRSSAPTAVATPLKSSLHQQQNPQPTGNPPPQRQTVAHQAQAPIPDKINTEVTPSPSSLSAAQTQTQTQTQPPPLSQPFTPPQSPAVIAPQNLGFPASWREMIDRWRAQKPLQARRLEEAHPLYFGSERIELAISESHPFIELMMRPEEQRKIKDAFAELFSFKGQLVISRLKEQPKPTESEAQSLGTVATTVQSSIPESVASIREKEDRDRKAALQTRAAEHPITQQVLSLIGGSIESISLNDGA
jgi:DNA polymerase III subunit gamma/tau